MFVPELSHTAPLEAVDAVLPDHVAWLDELYERGVVPAAGRREPRDGGVIVAVAGDRARTGEIAAGDPFARAGVCEYRVTEFVATKAAPALEPSRESAS